MQYAYIVVSCIINLLALSQAQTQIVMYGGTYGQKLGWRVVPSICIRATHTYLFPTRAAFWNAMSEKSPQCKKSVYLLLRYLARSAVYEVPVYTWLGMSSIRVKNRQNHIPNVSSRAPKNTKIIRGTRPELICDRSCPLLVCLQHYFHKL